MQRVYENSCCQNKNHRVYSLSFYIYCRFLSTNRYVVDEFLVRRNEKWYLLIKTVKLIQASLMAARSPVILQV